MRRSPCSKVINRGDWRRPGADTRPHIGVCTFYSSLKDFLILQVVQKMSDGGGSLTVCKGYRDLAEGAGGEGSLAPLFRPPGPIHSEPDSRPWAKLNEATACQVHVIFSF